MIFNIILAALPIISILFAAANGRLNLLTEAVLDGAEAAVTLCLSLAGIIMFWQAVLELMRRSGLLRALAGLLRPVLRRLFPSAGGSDEVMADLSANVTANLLGLGNAATPAGIRAAQGLMRLHGGSSASDELCLLVVMNTASIQLIPTTVAALRASLGSVSAFDILPAVWLASLCSVSAGIAAAKLMQRRRL